MLQLADCGLKDLKALRACNRLWEGIPLDYSQGKERVFVIVSRSGDLPKGHRMAVSRDSIAVLYIIREGYGD